ncbi:hypothetical protein PHYBOEH_009490 [Phytophthora boehmeriae]|uniref:Uncharacterized protein n=1 Tax=Phytophthora boehmeriae TaxID=109152 RepID=A0A8T1XF05_9STRA|nr:hypothetical protein PHYBOEH_009490 [Phytophthora boehmeriae]
MQPWTGGRRRERSSSVVLLKGKLSAIVRRGSIFQAEPEDGRGSGSGYSKEEGEEPDDSSDGRLSAVSAMTMWDPNASRNAQRFQFYPTRTLVAAALARPLGEEEVARRVALEAEMDSFEAMHMSFAPREVADKQEDEDDELDNNEMETLEEQERRAALEDDEEDASGEDESEGFAADEECLDFDEQNLGESVRTLVSRIRSQSLMGGSEVHVGSTTGSNQDDDEDEDDDDDDDDDEDDDNENDEDDEEHDYDGEVNCVEDVEDLDLDNNNGAHYKHYKHFEEDEQELEEDSKPTTSRLSERRRTLLLSCAAEQAALTAQDQLTSSVRRLVIELKDDSDRVGKPLAHSHGIRRKSLGAPPERKRAGSCPMPYDMSSGDMSTQGGEMSMPPPPPLSPPLAADDMYSDKKLHKKSAFSRIGPRVLKTLHLRKKRKTYLFTDQELETIEGARWKIVELAFRFGGKHRAYLVQAINMFFPLLNTNVVD